MATEITVPMTPASEYEALESILDAQRVGLIRKVEDVGDDEAGRAPTISSLSLLGLLKHAATWEERWLHVIMGGLPSSDGWPEVRPVPRDAELIVGAGDTVAHWLAVYRARSRRSNEIAAALSLDAPSTRPDLVECNLRYVLLHLIQETARHCGHADIIRETLDGSRGI